MHTQFNQNSQKVQRQQEMEEMKSQVGGRKWKKMKMNGNSKARQMVVNLKRWWCTDTDAMKRCSIRANTEKW